MSAYARFFKEWFDANKDSLRENGKLDITSMSRAIGQAWSDLQTSDPARVEELQAQTKAETAEFDKVYKEWFFERSLAERNVIEKATGRRLAFPGGRANFRRDLRHRPGNPGRPSSSFFEYLRSIQPELMEHPDVAGKRGIEGHQAAAKIAAERWRGLPEEEKAVSARGGRADGSNGRRLPRSARSSLTSGSRRRRRRVRRSRRDAMETALYVVADGGSGWRRAWMW